MKLSRIKGANLKGRHFEYPLEALNLIIAPPQSGKTAITEAIRLALLGYVPRLGKTPAKTLKLAGGAESSLEVVGTFDDGQVNRFAIKVNRGKAQVTDEVAVKVPAVLMDITSYLDLSGPARVTYVIDRLDLSKQGLSLDALTAKLKGIKIETPTEETEAAIRLLCNASEGLDAERHEFQKTWQQFLDSVLEEITAMRDGAKQTIDNAQGHVTSMAQLRAGEEVVSGNPADTLKEISHLEAAVAQYRAEIAGFERKQAEAIARAQARADLEKQIKALPEGDMEACRKMEDEAQAMEAVIMAYQSETGAREADRKAAGDLKPWAGLENHMTDILRQKAQAKEGVEINKKSLEDYHNRLKWELAPDKKHCPHCHQEGEAWKESLRKEIERLIKGATDSLEVYKISLEKLNEEAVTQLDLIQESKAQHEKALATLDDRVKAAKMKDAANAELKATWEAKRTLARSISGTLNRRVELEARLAGHPIITAPKEEDIQPFKRKATETEAQIDGLRLKWRSQTAAVQDAKRIEEAKGMQATAEAELMVSKLALVEIAAWKESLVAEGFEGLLTFADFMMKGIAPGNLQYHFGDIGWFDGPNWVGYETMSGTEELLVFAALSVALAQESPIRILILDELGRLDEVRKIDVLAKVVMALQHNPPLIDQFIGIDVSHDHYGHLNPKAKKGKNAPPQWNIIEPK